MKKSIKYVLLGSIMGIIIFYSPPLSSHADATNLSVTGEKFSINGQNKFLLFVSYFDGLGASDNVLQSDMDTIKNNGFDGIRILINWPCESGCSFSNTGHRLSAAFSPSYSSDLNSTTVNKLKSLINYADTREMIVDVTFHDFANFSGSGTPRNFDTYKTFLENTARDLPSSIYKNVYFDLSNEATETDNFGLIGSNYLSASDIRVLRNAVKTIDSGRIVTTSVGYSASTAADYLNTGGLDFVAFHDPRNSDWVSATTTWVNSIRSAAGAGRAPIHLQEPNRYDSGSISDWVTAAKNAKCAGGASWTFHTNAGYDLVNQLFFSRVSTNNLSQIYNGVSSVGWGTCAGSVPPPSGGGASGPQGICPAGYVELTGANASGSDPTATTGYFCDNDPVAATGVTYPVQGFLYCTASSGTTFVTTNTSSCNSRPGIRAGWSFPEGIATDENNRPIQFIGTVNCPGRSNVTIPNGNVMGGAWTTNPSTEGVVCIPGTPIDSVPPPGVPPPSSLPFQITLVEPPIATPGSSIEIEGSGFGNGITSGDHVNVSFFDSSRERTTVSGTYTSNSMISAVVPSEFTPGDYTVAIWKGDLLSNEIEIQIYNSSAGAPSGYSTANVTEPADANYHNFGLGIFPDVAWYNGKIWIAYWRTEETTLFLYSAKPDLSNVTLEKSIVMGGGTSAFPRLGVWNDVLYMAFRGEGPGFNPKLWRNDTDTIEILGTGEAYGNDPVAVGNGYVAWQEFGVGLQIRQLDGKDVMLETTELIPTGLSRIGLGGIVTSVDDDRLAIPWGTRAWFSGSGSSFVVVEGTDVGVLGSYEGVNPDFTLWDGEIAYTPHAIDNDDSWYAVATWGGPGVRLATFGDFTSTPIDASSGWNGNLAFDPTNNRWLLVSQFTNGENTIINGRIYNNDGTALGNIFQIDQPTSQPYQSLAPKVAYAPDIQRYLVVWVDQSPNLTQNGIIYGRFINPDGSYVGDVFLIYDGQSSGPIHFYASSKLNYDTVNHKFVLVWESRPGGNSLNIIMQTISSSGTPGPVVIVDNNTGSNITAAEPAIAIGNSGTEYCVAYKWWDRNNDSISKIGIVNVNSSTGVVGTETFLLSNSANNPQIVYNSSDNAYFVTYNENNNVMGVNMTSCNGTSASAVTQIQSNSGATSLAYNPKSNTYGIISQNLSVSNSFTILDSLGNILYETDLFTDPPETDSSDGNFLPAIAANTSNGTFAVTSSWKYSNLRLILNLDPSKTSSKKSASSGSGVSILNVFTQGINSIGQLIGNFYGWAISILGIIILLVIMYGGFQLLTAGGNAGKVDSAKNIIKGAIIGAIILFAAYLILYVINPDLIEGNFSFSGLSDTSSQNTASVSAPTTFSCTNTQALATKYGVPSVAKISPELATLMQCIQGKLPGVNLGTIYTYDQSYSACNFTRGLECGPCSHAANSCHYGGSSGHDGALGVDYSGPFAIAAGNRIITAAKACGAKTTSPGDPRCEASGGIRVDCSNSSATHVHVNAASCDRN